MAAPNIASLTSIVGKTARLAATTAVTAILSNAAASGKVLKVNALYACNIGGATKHVTVDHYRASVAMRLVYQVPVPMTATLVVIERDSPVYLEEGDDLRLTAETNGYLEVVASYEVLG